MLVAGDPDADPRIDWEASYAPREFAVTVMGVCGPPVQASTQHSGWQPEFLPTYAIVRLPRDDRPCAGFLRRGAELMIAAWLWPILAVLLLPFAAVVAVLELLCRSVKRRIGKRPVYESLRQGVGLGLSIVGFRIPISFFRHVVISSAALWRGIVAERLDEQAIVHCNDLDTLLVGVMARRAYGCKLVYDCHEFLPHAWPDATRWNRWLLGLYEGWLIRFADCVFTVNPLLAGEIMKAYPGIEVQSLPNAEPLREDWVDPLGVAGNDCKPLEFLFQGSFGPGRGIEELIGAWQAIDPNEAVLLLRGNDHAHKTSCVRLAESLGLKDVSVFFPPPVRENRLIATAAEADVGVIPYMPTIINFRYCCPNKLSQYMQAGLPVMAGNTIYVGRILVESGAGLCYDPADPESIAGTVRQLVRDEELRRRCRQNAARFVRETFHWQARSKPLYEAYRRLAGLTAARKEPAIYAG